MKKWIFTIIILLIPAIVWADSNWDSMTWDQDSWVVESGGSVINPVNDSGGGGCFIATAAYGSLMEPHVKILCEFRDRFLKGNNIGNSIIKTYYTYSPSMANFIANHSYLRAIVRSALIPVVGISWIALKLGLLPTMVLMLFFSISLIGLVRFRMDKK